MVKVDLSAITLSDDKTVILSSCMHNIDELNVSGCELTTRGIENIAAGIQKRTKPVHV